MKAWMVHAWGGPESMCLEEVDEGRAPHGMVRIAVQAVDVNFADALLVAGKYQARPPFPFTPGWVVAGTAISAPAGYGFGPGDRVCASLDIRRGGGYAEIADAEVGTTYHVPDGMPFEHALSLAAFQSAHLGLHRRAGLRSGETLLIHGAAGGVGSAALQLGRAAGAMVIATAGSEAKLELCRSLGADLVINHRDEDFVPVVRQFTAGRGADVVFDVVGGDVFDRSTKCVASEGRIVVVGFTSGRIPQASTNHLLLKNYSLVGLHWWLYRDRMPEFLAAVTAELLALYRAGKVRPYISATYAFSQAPEALSAVVGGSTMGKVALLA